ncbi:MAG: TauD/TfdA family dioxygenase [Acidobacteriota bacterium]
MSTAPFCWHPHTLRDQAAEWVIDLQDTLRAAPKIMTDMEADLPSNAEGRWRHYDKVRWQDELNPLVQRIKSLVLDQTGIAVLKCGSELTSDQARLIQLLLGCQFGVNITKTAEGDDRPLFAMGVKEDPTAEGRYLGNALKRKQIGFHTDGSGTSDRDVVLLSMLCIRPARFGGQSRISNSHLAFESLPEVAQTILQKPVPRQNPYAPELDVSSLRSVPIFQAVEAGQGYRSFSYHPDRIRDGVKQALGRVPLEVEAAFLLLEEALEAFSCDINLVGNEILFINNHVIAHDRRAFWNDPRAPRLLERFWAGIQF